MKKLLFQLVLIITTTTLFAGNLILIPVKSEKEMKQLANSVELIIHYSADDFIIATESGYNGYHVVLDSKAWTEDDQYFISWFHKGIIGDYKQRLSDQVQVLQETSHYIITKSPANIIMTSPTDGRVTQICSSELRFPADKLLYERGTLTTDPEIIEMMEAVDVDLYTDNLQHLQDFGTRDAYEPESVEAQNWIKEQFESYGYADVELFDFTMPGGSASDNVIVEKIGTIYPDEYVVIGCHYDSYSYSGNAPGADDNGTGTCVEIEEFKDADGDSKSMTVNIDDDGNVNIIHEDGTVETISADEDEKVIIKKVTKEKKKCCDKSSKTPCKETKK